MMMMEDTLWHRVDVLKKGMILDLVLVFHGQIIVKVFLELSGELGGQASLVQGIGLEFFRGED